jgi:cobalt-zinc-cadmium efflux system membrane fusion protein
MRRARASLAAWLLVAGSAWACGRHTTPSETPEPPHDWIKLNQDSPQLKFLKVETVAEGDGAATLALTARVAFDEDHTQRVSASLDGRATKLLVKVGDRVKVGQPLILITSPQVGELQSEAQRSNQDLSLAEKTVERAHKLRNDGAISEKDIAQAEADLAKARSAASQANARLASLNVSATDPGAAAAIYAQVEGTVVERNVLVGQEVRADAPAPLLTISELSTVWVLADVYEQDLGLVVPGADVLVRVPAYPGEAFRGTISHLGEVVDPSTRTVKLRCVLPNADQRLKPEMFARVELVDTGGRKTIEVPSAAVLYDSDHASVIVYGADEVFRLRTVEVGPEAGGKVRIVSGLTAGEKIVTEGALFLKHEIENR